MTLYVNDINAENSLKAGGVEAALRVQNILYVKKNPGPGEYSTPNAALAAITDNSISNPYKVIIGPGVYAISQLAMKSYVWVEGSEQDQTVLVASDPTNHLIIGADNSGISKCMFDGVTTAGKAAIYYASTTGTTKDAFFVEDSRFGHNDTLAIADASTAPTAIFLFDVKIGSYNQFNHGFLAQNGGRINARTITTTAMTSPYPDYVFKAIGSGSEIVLNSAQMRSGGTTTGACIHLADGANARVSSVNIKGFGKAVWLENTGNASFMDANAVMCDSNTMDIQIEHPGADGTFTGSVDHGKIFVNLSSTFSVVVACNAVPNDGTGSVTVGTILQGDRYDRLANLSLLARQATTLGQISGGAISIVSGLQISITAGKGFLDDPTDHFIKEITWDAANITLPANSTRYIYVDTNAVVTAASSLPSLETVIPLGRVVTNATGIRFIESSELSMNHIGNKLEYFIRYALGPVFHSGGTVTENATARKLDITSGNYFYGINQLAFAAANAFNFEAIYRDGSGGFNFVSGQDTVSNTQYDDGSGTLQSLPLMAYAKHTLYGVGNGVTQSFFLVYSQGYYLSLGLAEAAPLPIKPSFLEEGVVPIAWIVVQQGAANVTEVIDLRPRIGFSIPSSSASVDHGNLTGLLDDDHPQYLPLSGIRAMTGNLDMGNQNIVNANLINGVAIAAHASRHLPNGADPLTTAAPTGTLSATSANAVGIANSFARSDHSHDLDTGVVVQQTPDQVNAEGVSANLARADHVHNIPTAAPISNLSAATTNAQGTGSSFARNDHSHAITTGVVSQQTPDQVNAAGSSASLARADHVHNIPTASATGLGATSTNTQGVAATFARSDHTHAISSAAAVQLTPDLANAIGTSASFARADHIHNIPTAAAISLDANSTNTQGSNTSFARSNHTHAIASGVVIAQTPDQVNAAGTSANFAKADHVHNIATATAVTISNNTNVQGVAASFARSDHKHQLTNAVASYGHVPKFDGSNWTNVYPEALHDPRRSWYLYDDFVALDPGVTTTSVGDLNWDINVAGGGSSVTYTTATAANNRPGQISVQSGGAGGNLAAVCLNVTTMMRLGGGPLTYETSIQIPTLSTATNAFTVRIGMGDTSTADHANGVYFEYAQAKGNVWVIKSANSSTRTSQTTSQAIVAGTWYRLKIVVDDTASTVSYYVDDVQIGTSITTNIPTANSIGLCYQMIRTAGTGRNLVVDYVKLYQRFTTVR